MQRSTGLSLLRFHSPCRILTKNLLGKSQILSLGIDRPWKPWPGDMTRFLTIPQILFLHTRLIDETGGSHGLRDLGLLEAAQARPQATFEGKLLYPGLFDQAAALMDSLINNHPFLDGNKRAGITATGLFLQLNGYRLTASNKEMESFTMKVASNRLDIAEISAWLQSYSLPNQ